MECCYLHFYRIFSLFFFLWIDFLLKLNSHWTRMRKWFRVRHVVIIIIFLIFFLLTFFLGILLSSKLKAIFMIFWKFICTPCWMFTWIYIEIVYQMWLSLPKFIEWFFVMRIKITNSRFIQISKIISKEIRLNTFWMIV